VHYSSPNVTGPNGEDRRGKIWGTLVPWGLAPNNFGTATEIPWRAGANENTTVALSHDVLVQGKPLAAGTYGLHVVPQERGPWTVIFSRDSTSWGSFFYDPAHDALRVEATPEPAPFREWLAFDFSDRERASTTLALHWEELRLPLRIEVPDLTALYVDSLRKELQSSPGFTWQNWTAAATFLLGEDRELEQALAWAESAVSLPFIGQTNFTTLSTKALVLAKLGRADEATQTLASAIEHPTADAAQVHQLGRALLAQGDAKTALVVFQANFDRHQGAWPTHVGMARGLSAVGELGKALEHAKKALAQAPDPINKASLEQMVANLEQGKAVG
jgi:tetratricopeptide (TPR) repeat protein